jgi:hypothetical protein
VRELLVPKIPDPELPKLPTAPPVPVKIPFVKSFDVVPEAASAPVPVPDAAPPAEPKKLVALAEPLPAFVALPVLDPIPTLMTGVFIRVPVVVLAMLRSPLLLPKPPVGPVETGVTVEAPPGVVTVLNLTGLRPAPKPPVPEEVVVPPKVRVPSPPSVMPTFPPCEPVLSPVAFPSAVPNVVSMKPDPPLVVVNSPLPVPSATPTIPVAIEVWADPLPLASPLLVADPEMIPPLNCNFLDPLRLLRVGVWMRRQVEGCKLNIIRLASVAGRSFR